MSKISQLPELATEDVDGTETLPVVKDGATKRTLVTAFIQKLAAPYIALSKAYADSSAPPDPAEPAGKSAKGWATVAQDIFAAAQAVLPRRTGPEVGRPFGIIIGSRLIAEWLTELKAVKFYGGVVLPAARTFFDSNLGVPLAGLLARPTGPEANSGHRFIIGKRTYMTIDPEKGVYPRKMTVPASAKLDDDLDNTLAARLAGIVNGGQSGPGVTQIGDSLTAQMGNRLGLLLPSHPFYNLGVGGETSATIAGRVGFVPYVATVAGGVIPASGSVAITLTSIDGTAVSPLDQGSAGLNPVEIAGVIGNITKTGSSYSFDRSTAGAAVDVRFPKLVNTAASRDRSSDILIAEMGQNDGVNDPTAVINRLRAMIAWQTRGKYYLVGGITTSTLNYRAPWHQAMRDAFGPRYLNYHPYLASQAAQDDAGLTPSSDDLADIAAGRVPGNLRIDPTHFNGTGYQLKANFAAYRLTVELKWITP